MWNAGGTRYNPEPFTDGFPGMANIVKTVFNQSFIAKRPLKLLINPFCAGLPG